MVADGRGGRAEENMQRGSCLFSTSSSALTYRTKVLTPQSANPLVVFDDYFVTQQKVELVLKVEAVPDEFIVKSVKGDHWFTIAKKRGESYGDRVVQTASGQVICSIHKNEYPQVEGFSIVSHLESPPTVAIELHGKWKPKSKLQKMHGSIAMGGGSRTRSNLKIAGDLLNRMYGITWSDSGKKKGPLVAMTWDVCTEGNNKTRGRARYVMEIPAGVDAASMVAVATAICEVRDTPLVGKNHRVDLNRLKQAHGFVNNIFWGQFPLSVMVTTVHFKGDIPPLEMCKYPLEAQSEQSITVFGRSFVTKSQESFVMSDVNKRLNVVDASGCVQVSMDGLGVCRTRDGRNIFQLGEDGMSIQGVTEEKEIVNIVFSLYESEGHPQHLLAVVTCAGFPVNQIVLVIPLHASLDGVFPVRRVMLDDDKTDNWLMNGPVIARIMMLTRVNNSFETWFENARSQSPNSALPTCPPEIGIGADVACGVDICLVTALMLIMIKASPAAKRINARLTRIQTLPSKQMPVGGLKLEKSSPEDDWCGKQSKNEGSIASGNPKVVHAFPSKHPG